MGTVSRAVRGGTLLTRNGEARVFRRIREWSLITLDAPVVTDGRSARPTFYHTVIKDLLTVQGLPADHLYSWLEKMFTFCAGKPFVYYSR